MLVCNKPSGVLSQSDNENNKSILDDAKLYLKKKYNKAGDVFIGLVHRLDRPSSGALVLAKTSKALSRLNESFRNRITHKFYVCMVNGLLDGQGKCINYMIKNNDNKRIRCYDDKKDIKHGNVIEAELKFKSVLCKTLHINQSDVYQSLIDIEMETGRKHQIRCQMAHLGYPIVGDIKYGAGQSFRTRDIALHSYGIVIAHPITNKPIFLAAQPPQVWITRFGLDVHDYINNLIAEKRAMVDGD